MIITSKKNVKLSASFLKKKIQILISNKVSFLYLITNFKLFNFSKNLFFDMKKIKIVNLTKQIKKLVINNMVFLSRGLLISATSLELLFKFNTFFLNKGVLLVGVWYNNFFYSFSSFKSLILNINIKLIKLVRILQQSLICFFYILKKVFLLKKLI